MFILDLEKVQFSRPKQQQFLKLFFNLFESPDQITMKLLIPILTCPDLNTCKKYATTSFRPSCVPNITIKKL